MLRRFFLVAAVLTAGVSAPVSAASVRVTMEGGQAIERPLETGAVTQVPVMESTLAVSARPVGHDRWAVEVSVNEERQINFSEAEETGRSPGSVDHANWTVKTTLKTGRQGKLYRFRVLPGAFSLTILP